MLSVFLHFPVCSDAYFVKNNFASMPATSLQAYPRFKFTGRISFKQFL